MAFSDEVLQSLVGKLQKFGETLPGPEQELLEALIEAATTLPDEALDGASGGAGAQPMPGGPDPRGRIASPGTPAQPGSGIAAKLRRF